MKQWWSAADRRSAQNTRLLFLVVGTLLAVTTYMMSAFVAAGMPSRSEGLHWLGRPVPIILGLLGAGIAVSAWVWMCLRWVWPVLAPTGEGFATRQDVSKHLSERSARRKAAITRPDLTKQERRQAPASDIGIPCHIAPWGQPMWLPFENPTGVLAPTQSGKSLTDLIHKVLAAPGALVTTSTKLDLFRLTARARERIMGEGTVAVLDLTGTSGWPRIVRWDVLGGCHARRTAHRRAESLVKGARPGGHSSSTQGNHAFFEGRAIETLAALMQAAAIAKVPLKTFVAWCQNEEDPQPAEILLSDPATREYGRSLHSTQNLVQETRDGVFETVRDAISCLIDPVAREMCVGEGAASFSVEKFLERKGTVYILGSEQTASDMAPLVTAFVSELFFRATEIALESPAERISPPLSAVLDELANICPLPRLPETLSDSAGRGLLIHWAAQSRPQLETSFGKEGAETLIDNTTALSVFGGLKSRETLQWLSTLAGRRWDERRSRKSSPLEINLDRQVQEDRHDLLDPGQIRKLPAGRVLLLVRSLPPVIAVTRKAWELDEWKTLQADRNALRALSQAPNNIDAEEEAAA